jgi:AAA+ ATPase superfamily predicted ATPase
VVNKYLAVLRELYLIQREVPITENRPHKSRKGVYLLRDPFFRFWFRYVFPNIGYLEEGERGFVWQEKILPSFESFVGPVFESICHQTLKRLNRENALPFKASRLGRWWDRANEIDIIAYNDEGAYLFCECQWSKNLIGKNILETLQEKTALFPEATQKYFGLFSRTGFQGELKALAAQRSDILLLEY